MTLSTPPATVAQIGGRITEDMLTLMRLVEPFKAMTLTNLSTSIGPISVGARDGALLRTIKLPTDDVRMEILPPEIVSRRVDLEFSADHYRSRRVMVSWGDGRTTSFAVTGRPGARVGHTYLRGGVYPVIIRNNMGQVLRLFLSIGIDIVKSGYISPLATFVRPNADSAARATVLDADELRWSQHGANEPRFWGARQLLLCEGRETNFLRNPRSEGAVVGTPGIAPSFWGVPTAPLGLIRSVVGVGTAQGMRYVDIRITGTATPGGDVFSRFELPNVIPAGVGQTWIASAFLSLVNGSLANTTAFRLRIEGFNVSTRTELLGAAVVSGLDATLRRFEQRAVLVNAETTSVTASLEFGTVAGPVDITLRIGWQQLERDSARRSLATTPSLPPTGTLSTSLRGSDHLAGELDAFSFGSRREGALEIVFVPDVPELIQSSTLRRILQIEGDAPSPATCAVSFDSVTMRAVFDLIDSGVPAGVSDIGPLVTDSDNTLRVSWTEDGTFTFVLNGGSPLIVPSVLSTSLFERFTIGNTSSGNSPSFSFFVSVRAFPVRA